MVERYKGSKLVLLDDDAEPKMRRGERVDKEGKRPMLHRC